MPDATITRNALATSLKTLMAEKPFAKISVGDICDHCGMNRRSFYYHFQDKYDLIVWIYNSEFLDVMYQKEYESSWEFVLDVCAYFHENRLFYLDLFSASGQNSFQEYFMTVFSPLLHQSFEQEFGSTKHAAFFAEFYADAFTLSLQKWLRKGAMPPEEYVELLRQVLEHTAKHVIRQMDQPLSSHASSDLSPDGSFPL